MGSRRKRSYLAQSAEDPAVQQEISTMEWPTAIYARLSIENSKKDDHGESIEGQIDICRDYLEEHPYLHLVDTYVDNGWTGTNTNRPAFQRLLQDIETGKIKAMVIKDFSRFSRDYIEAGNLLENVFPIYHIRFVSVVDHYDSYLTDGSAESLLIPLKNLINDFYSKDMSRKVCTAIHAKQLAGEHIPSMIAYGYRKSTTQAYRYEPDPETAPVVTRIFQMRVDGVPIGQIARTLQNEGIPSPGKLRYLRGITKDPRYANTQWTANSIKNILQNPVYMGDMVFGRTPLALYQGKSEEHYEHDESRWRILKDMHEPLVMQDVFEQVKAMAAENRKQNAEHLAQSAEYRSQNVPVFHDVIYCGDCGAHMTYSRARQNSGRLTGRYFCPNGRYKKCTSRSITQESLEDIVWQSIQLQIAVFCDYKKLQQLLEAGGNTSRLEECRHELKSLQIKIQHKNEQRNRLYEDYIDGILTLEEYMLMKKRYETECEKLKGKINLLQNRLNHLKRIISDWNDWMSSIQKFASATEFSPDMLSALVDKVLVYQGAAGEKRIEIQYKYAADLEALQKAMQELREGAA